MLPIAGVAWSPVFAYAEFEQWDKGFEGINEVVKLRIVGV
jgi:hypothetical protein